MALCKGRCRQKSQLVTAALYLFLFILSLSAESPSNGTPVCAGLEGLDADTFFEESYKRLLLRYPENVTSRGLKSLLYCSGDRLDDYSEEYLRETQELERGILELLRGYDGSKLNPSQKLTAKVYDWYLDDLVRGQKFANNNYPVNPGMFSVHSGLMNLFTAMHPVGTRQEAQDYLIRLSRVNAQLEQLVDGLQRRERIGAVLPRFLIGLVCRDIEPIARSRAIDTPFYRAFEAKIKRLFPREGAEMGLLLADAEKKISESVIPGYRLLLTCLSRQMPKADNRIGLWKQYKGGDAYDYLLRHYTTSNLNASRISKIGKDALERIHAEMRREFKALGYDDEKGLPNLYRKLARDGGVVTGSQIVPAYEQIIREAKKRTAALFSVKPGTEVIVIGSQLGGAYMAPALDGSRPGIFYTCDKGDIPRFSMASLAYHEAIPGHHHQMALAQELDLPLLRRDIGFTSFIEGWALYAERLAKEIGLYDNDPLGNLGRLQYEAYRAARLVVDTGIHARRWTFQRAVDFMVRNTGMNRSNMQGEVIRYISTPGQAAAYYIGFMKIMELRERVRGVLGKRFDLREFHDILLGNGALPLPVLENVVDDFIASKNPRTAPPTG